jgi:apolipoprotein N-acyltransferase
VRAALAAGYALVTFLSFPHPLAGSVVDLGWAMSWLGPALLGLGAGLAAHAAILHWAYIVTVVYGHSPVVVGLLAPIGLASYGALFTAAFAAGAAALGGGGRVPLWSVAAAWAALDHGRSWILGGFPWATLGYAQHENVALLGIAQYSGVFGLSFVTVLGGAAIARMVRARRIDRETAVALVAIVALHGLGLAAQRSDAPDADRVRIGVVQGNVDQGEKWSPTRFEATVRAYEDGTRRLVADGAQIVVWPETAIPSALQRDPLLKQRLAALARDSATVLVVGAMGTERRADGGFAYYDSAFLIGADGAWLGRYDKAHLVPFGEYLPLRSLIGGFVQALASGVAAGDVTPGAAPVAFDVPLPARPGARQDGVRSVRLGVPICYELLFPDGVRRFVRDGAGGLLAITNDAWYGRTGAPYQFLAITELRSAETGVWTVRAANTGVSAVIDASGRVREQTKIFEAAVLIADVPIAQSGDPSTFYVRHGDVFAWLCWGGWAAAALGARFTRRGAREGMQA